MTVKELLHELQQIVEGENREEITIRTLRDQEGNGIFDIFDITEMEQENGSKYYVIWADERKNYVDE